MTDAKAQAAFHRAMEENPDDDHVRRVYADWLDDRGHSVQAARLRWTAGLNEHVRHTAGKPHNEFGSKSVSGILDRLPGWASRIVQLHHVRRSLAAQPLAEGQEAAMGLTALAERHALGLASDKDVRGVPGVLDAHIDDTNANLYLRRSLQGLFSPSGVTAPSGVSAARMVQWHHNPVGEESMYLHYAVNHARAYADQNPPPHENAAPVKLAAIEPSNRPQGTVLVKVPNPNPPAVQSNVPPAADKKAAPASGPAWILPL